MPMLSRLPRRACRALTVAAALLLPCGAPLAAQAAAMLAPGDAFPAWSMPDQSGKQVSSKDLAGKTYLLWYYPKAMTPGCTAEGNALRDSFPALSAQGVEVLGVSFDEPADNAKFVEAQQFPFRLLSDDGALAVQVGAAESRDQATTRRISYLVGPDGKVLRAYGTVNPASHAQEVLGDASAGGAAKASGAPAP